MNFLIMTRLPEIYSSQRLVQEIVKRGHVAIVGHPESSWPETPIPDVVIPRLGNFRYPETMQSFFNNEIKFPTARVLNPSQKFKTARHKLQAHQALGSLAQPKNFSEATQFPIVVKDCISSKGEGVFLCHDQTELEQCLFKLQGREILFQEYIPESAGVDVRAFVVGKKLVASMERRSPAQQDFRANLSLGGIASVTDLTTDETELCLKAVEALQLDYAGVDFIRSKRGPLILEINPCPGLEGIEKCTRANVAQEVVIYAEGLFSSRL